TRLLKNKPTAAVLPVQLLSEDNFCALAESVRIVAVAVDLGETMESRVRAHGIGVLWLGRNPLADTEALSNVCAFQPVRVITFRRLDRHWQTVGWNALQAAGHDASARWAGAINLLGQSAQKPPNVEPARR